MPKSCPAVCSKQRFSKGFCFQKVLVLFNFLIKLFIAYVLIVLKFADTFLCVQDLILAKDSLFVEVVKIRVKEIKHKINYGHDKEIDKN